MNKHYKNKSGVIWTGVPNNPNQIKQIKDAVKCTYELYAKIQSAKEELTDIYNELHSTTGIPRRTFNFLAKHNYNGKGRDLIAQNNEFEEVLEAVDAIYV